VLSLLEPQTQDNIRFLAQKIIEGRVVDAGQMPEDLVRQVFLPIAFDALKDLSDTELEQLVVFAIHGIDFSLRRTINGFPIFFECRVWLRSDFQQAVDLAVAANEQLQQTLKAWAAG
jgi:hypothetical protein